MQKIASLKGLMQLVAQRPLVIFRFHTDEWEKLSGSRRGFAKFTLARSHTLLEDVRTPTACLLFGGELGAWQGMRFALLRSSGAITTLETGVTVSRARSVSPSSERELLGLLTDGRLLSNLKTRLASADLVVRLSAKLSARLVEKLAGASDNLAVMLQVMSVLDAPSEYTGNDALQADAVRLALAAFDLPAGEVADALHLAPGHDTALAHVDVREDAVIEHDARFIQDFTLAESDITGRAVFRKGPEQLEVITANKRPLEEVLGVDLIYLNAIKQSIVMIQYKMLEGVRNGAKTEWVYRVDKQLEKEISRMKLFSRSHGPGRTEYRINSQVFYLRFVRRDAALGKNTITMPLDHFEILREDLKYRGPRGGFRVSFKALDGRYLRQTGFLELLRCGYIGAYATTTADLVKLVQAILRDGRAVVAAVQSSLH